MSDEIKRAKILEVVDFQKLLNVLQGEGYEVVGPTRQEEAIVYDRITRASDLPIGWTDEQDGGHYRLKKRDDQAYFGYAVGPHSWKKFLFPPKERLWQGRRTKGGFDVQGEAVSKTNYAFLGVRSCELQAIAIQDKVFIGGSHVDPAYQARRKDVLMIAVQCGQAGGTCFCVSMGTGPKCESGYDMALTEVISKDRHFFVVTIGTERGAQILAQVPHREATPETLRNADDVVAATAQEMGRTMDISDIKELLYGNLEHPRWDNVAERCLSCANCTLVCPTCFCSTVEDVTDLTGEHTERWRQWDSCFTMDFSNVHGAGSLRSSTKSRYRQWMTHKLASWIDQFGTSGCVGCGRCISWCPVGIDLTEEVTAIRKTDP